MKTKALIEPKQRKAFRDKYLAAVLAVAALFISFVAEAQTTDSLKYSPINGYGFKYKRHVSDSVQLIPLSTSPHVPYRMGAIRYRASDSTLQLWTGHQWNSILTGVGNGIDTAFAYDDSTLSIETPNRNYFVKIKGKPSATQLNDSAFIVGDDTITIHGTGGGQNLSNASLTANGDYFHDWANHYLDIENISTLGLIGTNFTIQSSGLNGSYNRQQNTTLTGSGTNGSFPLSISHVMRNAANGADSISNVITATGSVAMNIYSQNAGTGRKAEIVLNQGGSGSSFVQIKGDSVNLQGIPRATADSVWAVGPFVASTKTNSLIKVPFSGGGSATLSNIGSGYRLVKTANGQIKTTFAGYGIIKDSTTNTDGITDKVDTSSTNHIVTQSDLNDTAAAIRAAGGSSATAGIQTTVTNNAINYDPRVNSNLIFNDFLTSSVGANWDISNAPNTTITFSAGHMRLAGGSSTDYIYDSLTTMLHRWTEEIGGVIRSVASSDTFAFGISVLGEQKILVKVKASNLSSIMIYRTGSTITTMGTTSSQGTTSVGDSVRYKLRRDNYNLYVDIINKTQSTSQTLTYPFSNIDAVSGTVIPFRELSITINNLSGTFDVDYAKLYNQERLYADWAFVGTSITDGFNAVAPDSTFYNRLQNCFPDKRLALYALSGSKAGDFITGGSRQNDLLALRAKRAIVMFGPNEVQASVTTQAFVSNVRALVDTLENHGTQVMVCNVSPYNAANKSAIIAYNAALLAEFGNQLINIYDTLEVGGLMQSSNDSLHPDAQGHRYLFNVFKDEITRLANVPYDPEGIIRIFPRGIESGTSRLGVQSNFGLIPLNIGTSGTNYPSIGYNIKYSTTSGVHNYKASDVSTKIEMGSNAGANIGFYTAPSGTAGDPITFTQQMAVTPTGIGIGSTNAVSYLHIKKNGNSLSTLGNSRWITLDDIGGANNKRMEIGLSYLNGNTYSASVLGIERVGNTGYTLNNIYLANREDDSGDNPPIIRLLIRPNGRIGINTTTPSFGLDVQRSMGANKDSIDLQATTSTRQMLVIDTATGKFQRMTIPSGGSNFANANLTFTGNRTHTQAGYSLSIVDNAENTLKLDPANGSYQFGKSNTNGAYLALDTGANSATLQAANAHYMTLDAAAKVSKIIMNGGYQYMLLDADNSIFKFGDISSAASGNNTFLQIDDANQLTTLNAQLKLSSYGSGTYTGSITNYLGVTSNGTVVETPSPTGSIAIVNDADHTVSSTESAIRYHNNITATRTVTLPAASSNTGREIWVKCNTISGGGQLNIVSSSTIYLDGTAGSTSQAINVSFSHYLFKSDGTSWYSIN